MWPLGAISAANGIIVADTSADVWTAASGTANLQVYAAQLVSLAAAAARPVRRPRLVLASVGLVPLHGAGRLADQAAGHRPGRRHLPARRAGLLPEHPGLRRQQHPDHVRRHGGAGDGDDHARPVRGQRRHRLRQQLHAAAARPRADLFLFQGDLKLQILNEVLSGAGMVRFQAFQYLAAMPNRYVAAAATGSSVSAGGDVAHATLTSQHSGSLLILSGSGY